MRKDLRAQLRDNAGALHKCSSVLPRVSCTSCGVVGSGNRAKQLSHSPFGTDDELNIPDSKCYFLTPFGAGMELLGGLSNQPDHTEDTKHTEGHQNTCAEFLR